ncbi:hypothetical protein PA08_0690 [Cutibacterium modestum P08]|nr:hypothetical protein PA08_0690 [Cutibacterium modestum P08]
MPSGVKEGSFITSTVARDCQHGGRTRGGVWGSSGFTAIRRIAHKFEPPGDEDVSIVGR